MISIVGVIIDVSHLEVVLDIIYELVASQPSPQILPDFKCVEVGLSRKGRSPSRPPTSPVVVYLNCSVGVRSNFVWFAYVAFC